MIIESHSLQGLMKKLSEPVNQHVYINMKEKHLTLSSSLKVEWDIYINLIRNIFPN